MNLETVAEYAESQAILDCLHSIGINYAQGFLIHKPEPLERVLNKTLDLQTVEA